MYLCVQREQSEGELCEALILYDGRNSDLFVPSKTKVFLTPGLFNHHCTSVNDTSDVLIVER